MKIIAPAKLNLFLHITGRRDDGYHLLESVFIFTDVGDDIIITPSASLSLHINGLFQPLLCNEPIEKNLAYRAALLLQKKYHVTAGAHIHLTKNIPVGAGLGGGSSDAAAVLKGLNTFWNLNLDLQALQKLGLMLGADVPACIAAHAAFVSGIGENITPIDFPDMPSAVLLVNPQKPLSTSMVFQYYKNNHLPFTKKIKDKIDFAAILKNHNDLEPVAIQLAPEIQTILTILNQQPDCALARMSGSGPTCFGLFNTITAAQSAEKIVRAQFPDYWIARMKCNIPADIL